MDELVFLKLGGSLITDKARRYSPRLDKLRALAAEIQTTLVQLPDTRLIVGHGSGSFGHVAVNENLAGSTYEAPASGVAPRNEAYWTGFAEVWYRASELNHHVMDALHSAGIAAISIAPSATVATSDGQIVSWDLTSLDAALKAGLVPVIFGDIVFDRRQGSKVLSTEALMIHLARHLKPQRILLAGLEEAVWADYPHRRNPVHTITPPTYGRIADGLGGAESIDVTGGMRSKVEEMLQLVQELDSLTVHIFSGEPEGNLGRALAGAQLGTKITQR